ncbi:hypothetical protein CDAR_514121 [Caerostris darwini]|uniref:Uncharacterized protein n=1 Tax=Caerostris darwini TaxID=1538125 RepID=A0AAV4UNL6_9ARAC|nr:hypothetical protein CDAR_514121 [Caerostris darwini]
MQNSLQNRGRNRMSEFGVFPGDKSAVEKNSSFGLEGGEVEYAYALDTRRCYFNYKLKTGCKVCNHCVSSNNQLSIYPDWPRSGKDVFLGGVDEVGHEYWYGPANTNRRRSKVTLRSSRCLVSIEAASYP